LSSFFSGEPQLHRKISDRIRRAFLLRRELRWCAAELSSDANIPHRVSDAGCSRQLR
jgi:hypothetical protein